MINKKVGIIGCGNMGEALLKGLSKVLEKSTSIMVSELDAGKREYIQDKYKIIVEIDNNRTVKFADVIVLAVKPKDFENLLKTEVCCGVSKDKLIVSIAAGITTKYIESIVGKDVPVVRAMPNMGALIGHAVTSLSKGSCVKEGDMALAREIFSLIGDVVEVDEKHVDAVTAVSGSGPAYFFFFIEALYEVAEEMGLKSDIAKKLVMKTALGSVKLLHELKEEPEDLRKRVTSKGGTTEAALKVMEYKKIKKIIKDAVKAAQKRSGELSKK